MLRYSQYEITFLLRRLFNESWILRKQFRYSMIALALTTFCAARVLAQGGHQHAITTQHEAPAHNNRASARIKIVRESTKRFKDVSVARAEGYVLQFERSVTACRDERW